jgi:hypothetical protein
VTAKLASSAKKARGHDVASTVNTQLATTLEFKRRVMLTLRREPSSDLVISDCNKSQPNLCSIHIDVDFAVLAGHIKLSPKSQRPDSVSHNADIKPVWEVAVHLRINATQLK